MFFLFYGFLCIIASFGSLPGNKSDAEVCAHEVVPSTWSEI